MDSLASFFQSEYLRQNNMEIQNSIIIRIIYMKNKNANK